MSPQNCPGWLLFCLVALAASNAFLALRLARVRRSVALIVSALRDLIGSHQP